MLRRSLAVLPFVMLVLTLLAAAPAWAQAALTVEKTDDPDPVAEGQILTYTVDVTNTGTTPTTTDVAFTDQLPVNVDFDSVDTTEGTCSFTAPSTVNCNLGVLADDEVDTVTIRVRPTNTVAGSTITNTAQATAGPASDTDQENTRVTPNLTIVKEDSPGRVEVGDDLRYILEVENRGGANAEDVRVIDTLPPEVEFVQSDADQGDCDEQPEGVVECDLGTIAAGATVRIKVLVRATEAGDITNRAQVFARDTEEAIDEDTETTEVEDNGGNNGGGGGGGGGNGSSNSNSSCQGAEVAARLSSSATDDEVTFEIKGNKFEISSNVTEDNNGQDITIEVRKGQKLVDTFDRSEGVSNRVVKEGSGTFTVEVVDPGNAVYELTIDDCTGSDQNDNNNNGNNNNRNNNNSNNDRNSLLNDFDRDLGEVRGDGSFRCEQILEIEQSADRDQYDFSAERIDECRRDEVLTDTIPDKRLPDTGGSPLVLLAAAVLLVTGLFAGASVFRAGFAARRRD